MKSGHRALSVMIFGLALQMPAAAAQDLLTMSRNLERASLEVWQSVHSRFQQLAAARRLTETDMSLYFSLNAFSKSATLFRELIATRNLTELRGGCQAIIRQAVEIENLFDQSTGFSGQFDDWRNVQGTLSALAGSANLPYAPLGDISRRPTQTEERDRMKETDSRGRFWWRGIVDGSDRIRLRRDQVSIEHIESQKVRDDSYDLSSPLPRREIAVTLRKIKGRGRVEIVEQPSARNGYSVAVLLEDRKGGADTYEFELTWDPAEPAATRIPRP